MPAKRDTSIYTALSRKQLLEEAHIYGLNEPLAIAIAECLSRCTEEADVDLDEDGDIVFTRTTYYHTFKFNHEGDKA